MTNAKTAANLRADAALVLYEILENGKSSRNTLPNIQAKYLNPKDRAWLQEMVFGCLRQLPKLQIWLRALLQKPLKKRQKIAEHLLMLGFYQLEYTRTAEHAAVSETVQACRNLKLPNLSGLVNAILREFQRSNLPTTTSYPEFAQCGVAKWLHRDIAQNYPDQKEDIFAAMQTRAPIFLRVNRLETSVQEYCALLTQADIAHSVVDYCDSYTIKLESAGEISALPGYQQGLFSVQDLAAQQAHRLLNVQANDRVLDCCAAPGGKAAAILESEQALSKLTILDIDSSRMTRIHENFERLQLSNENDNKLEFVTQDASQPILQANGELAQYDKILLDAPCSATGVIRRHPDIMWLRKPSDIDNLVNLQAQILEQMWQQLAPNGVLLYATCSVLPAENNQQIESFLSAHANACLEKITTLNGDVVDTWQILPGQDNMDGFFYARIRKNA